MATKKLKTLKDITIEEIIKEWLIEEKLSLGRIDMPLPKVSYGQLRRLLYLIRQRDREEAIKWVKILNDDEEDQKKYNYDFKMKIATIEWIKNFFNITEEDLK